jgi:protein tyrosine phosphatase (PTP) superfamily phosphohydrolase (DUF442 family)
MTNEKSKRYMNLIQPISILYGRLTDQGVKVTTWWAADHFVRILTGAPIRRVSQITPQLHVGGQYRRRGWRRLARRGITGVVNLRIEFDDNDAGIAPPRYLYLPTVDDAPPTLDQLRQASEFIADEVQRGGAVYVHCRAGVGRAATAAAAYLVSAGLTVEEAWACIQQVRPFIRPKPAQIEQVARFAAQCQGQPHPNSGDNAVEYETEKTGG